MTSELAGLAPHIRSLALLLLPVEERMGVRGFSTEIVLPAPVYDALVKADIEIANAARVNKRNTEALPQTYRLGLMILKRARVNRRHLVSAA